jgi:Fibronectin type III domain
MASSVRMRPPLAILVVGLAAGLCALGTMALPVGASGARAASSPSGAPRVPTGASTAFDPTLALLTSLTCPGPKSCFAVGHTDDVVAEVAHWDGVRWSVTRSFRTGTTFSQFDGVSCASEKSCFAVGTRWSGPQPSRTLVGKWDGSAWSVSASPSPAGGYLQQVACSSASACTAIGFANADALVEHWNGTAWTIDSTPTSPSDSSHFLKGVACPTAKLCFVVGSDAAGKARIEQWDGAHWTDLTPVTHRRFSTLSGVACSDATNCTAVGDGDLKTLVEHWNGKSWSVSQSPNAAGNNLLDSLDEVSCPTRTSCFAVGNSLAAGSSIHPLLEHWNGTKWAILTVPTPLGVTGDTVLSEVSCGSATSCMALGGFTYQPEGGGPTLLERWDGTRWSLAAHYPPQPSAPRSVMATPGNGQATVFWMPPLRPNAGPVTSYRVVPYLNGKAQTAYVFHSAATSEVVPSLQNGQSYTFKIAAINSYGQGAQSAASAPITVGAHSAPG